MSTPSGRSLTLRLADLMSESGMSPDEQVAELSAALVVVARRAGVPWAGLLTALAIAGHLAEGADEYEPLHRHLGAFGGALARESRS